MKGLDVPTSPTSCYFFVLSSMQLCSRVADGVSGPAPKWVTMSRRNLILSLACSLLAGVVANVVVAWSCVRWQRASPTPTISSDAPSSVHRWQRIAPIPFAYDSTKPTVVSRLRGSEQVHVFGMGTGRQWTYRLSEHRAGWPARSLAGQHWADNRPGHLTDVYTNLWRRPTIRTGEAAPVVLNYPLMPLWPGFVANAIAYAAVLWTLLVGPTYGRQALRRLRHQCSKCGYPVGSSSACTECGQSVPQGLRPRQRLKPQGVVPSRTEGERGIR